MASRFVEPVSDADEASLCATAIPSNSKAATDWGIRVWNDWAKCRPKPTADSDGIVPLTTPLLEIPPVDLSYWLRKFVLEIRKRDGSEYPPKSIYALVCCFKRYFEHHGIHGVNPLNLNDARFGDFRGTLDAEMKRLHGKGLGTTTKQAEPISSDDESLLWSSGQFGSHNAQALLNTVYFYNCKVFGLRSFDEHRNLKCAQFVKKVDEKARVYIEYTDFGSKTNRGGLRQMKVENKTVRHYENLNDSDHCVVNLLVKYLECIPSQDGFFYFRPLPNDGSEVPRFSKQLVGRNTLSQLIPKMCKNAGIQGRKTGHSGKVTCATVLYQNDFSDQLIKERRVIAR